MPGHIARAMHFINAFQRARLEIQLVISEQTAQTRVVTAQIIHANRHRAVLRAVTQNLHRIMLAIRLNQHLTECFRCAEHDGQVLHRVILRLGPDDVVLAADHVAQNAVDQSGQRLKAHRTGSG